MIALAYIHGGIVIMAISAAMFRQTSEQVEKAQNYADKIWSAQSL